jgi:hypothetical protein
MSDLGDFGGGSPVESEDDQDDGHQEDNPAEPIKCPDCENTIHIFARTRIHDGERVCARCFCEREGIEL